MRRGEPDLKVLALDIKLLRGVVVRASERAGALSGQDGLNRDYTDQRLVELLGDKPAITEANRPALQPVEQETEGDRAAKRIAREER